MKTNSIISGVAACLLAVSLTACDKAKDMGTAASDAAAKAKDAAGSAMDATKDAAGKAVDTAKDAAAGAVDATKDAVAKADGPVGEAIAAAKKACDEKNYQGALDELKKLSGTTLTPEQQTMVDNMKSSIEKMMSEGAAKVGDPAAAADAAKAALPK